MQIFTAVYARCVLAALFFGMAALGAPAAAAVPSPGASPEEVAAAAFAHMQAGEWEASAELFDPGELKRFRDMMQSVLDVTSETSATGAAPRDDEYLTMLFGAGASVESVRSMSDQGFMAAMLSALIGGGQVQLREQRSFGHVAESDDIVHVVTRNSFAVGEVTASKMEVITLRRTPNGWRLAMKGEMTGLAERLSAALKGARGPQTRPAED